MPWVNGVWFPSPGAQVTVNTTALQAPPSSPSLGLLLIGPATDGQPQTAITLTSPLQAEQVLKGGDLLQAALDAFNPQQPGGSPNLVGVSSMTVMRPEEATQGTSAIKSSGAVTQISLTTTAYGSQADLSKWSVQAGSVTGYLVTQATDFTGPGGQSYQPASSDNTALQAATLLYTGEGTSPNYTVTDAAFTVSATGSDTGGTVNFTATMTMLQLVNAINQLAGWEMTLTDPNPADLVLPGSASIPALLDNVSAASVSTTEDTPTPVTANVAAVVNWINSAGAYFTAVRSANATSLATSASWTYATGGTTPSATNQDWTDCFTAAQRLNGVFVVTPVIGSSTIWAMGDTYCKYMAGIGRPRRQYVGDVLGQTLADEITAATTLNSTRTSLVWCGSDNVNYNGVATTLAPYLVAAQIAGARCGVGPQGWLTAQAIGSTGMEVALTPTDVGNANQAGIACLAQGPTNQTVLSWDRTTWTGDTNPANVENLTGIVGDYITVDLNTILQGFVGAPITQARLGQAKQVIVARLNYWFQLGLIVTSNGLPPPSSSVTLQQDGTAIVGGASVALIEPGNFWQFTLYAQPYSLAA